MKVQVNNKEVEMTPASTLTQLAAQLGLPVQGIAIAVNNKMIPRTEWECFILHGIPVSNRHSWHSKGDASGYSYA